MFEELISEFVVLRLAPRGTVRAATLSHAARPATASNHHQRPAHPRMAAMMSRSRGSSLQVDGYFMVGDPLVPSAQCPPGALLDDGPLIVVSRKCPDRVQAGEARDRGEHDLLAILPAQQAGAAKTADGPQMAADLRFEMTLVIAGSGLRRPSAPDPRDHSPSFASQYDILDYNIASLSLRTQAEISVYGSRSYSRR
jgi:hypothetical protein